MSFGDEKVEEFTANLRSGQHKGLYVRPAGIARYNSGWSGERKFDSSIQASAERPRVAAQPYALLVVILREDAAERHASESKDLRLTLLSGPTRSTNPQTNPATSDCDARLTRSSLHASNA